jgi:hypothetical protein
MCVPSRSFQSDEVAVIRVDLLQIVQISIVGTFWFYSSNTITSREPVRACSLGEKIHNSKTSSRIKSQNIIVVNLPFGR